MNIIFEKTLFAYFEAYIIFFFEINDIYKSSLYLHRIFVNITYLT